MTYEHAIPDARHIVSAFEQRPAGDHVVRLVAHDLARHHDEQWALEDRTRDALDDAEVAACKRRIDLLNIRRSAAIDQIDEWITGRVPADDRVTPHTETLGQLVDRMAVAWVRAHRLTGTVEVAQRQFSELCLAFDGLRSDLDRGHRRLPRWRMLKRYGSHGTA